MSNGPTYLSAAALEDLKKELQNRIKTLRPEIAQKIGDAKEMGDLSENFAYHEAREQQAMNETRIIDIQDMLVNAVVVDEKKGGTIGVGSRFTAKSGSLEKVFEIVGENEANPMEGKISNVSPIGNAFLGHSVGDMVTVTVPSGKMEYEILSIE
ncbi:MAG: transcription elongation factor GreA [Patescibacteria group bacterium]|jgi:transcription elongation factor GreA|nr:transcription elongation factor GreA [Patescibacteria group bacterium]